MHDDNATPAPDASHELPEHPEHDAAGQSRRSVLRTAGIAGAGLGLGAFTGGTAQAAGESAEAGRSGDRKSGV
ncbi:twin-arginine translocation signal domain-containing protein, partial [Streptomyces sp. NPDC000188]|uniref:twin-arginine translocation signal domain-containing protein n=1 Tax=Streptomyces sp. NPDC000188 TaxID=3154245 RepID=UPI003329042F